MVFKQAISGSLLFCSEFDQNFPYQSIACDLYPEGDPFQRRSQASGPSGRLSPVSFRVWPQNFGWWRRVGYSREVSIDLRSRSVRLVVAMNIRAVWRTFSEIWDPLQRVLEQLVDRDSS